MNIAHRPLGEIAEFRGGGTPSKARSDFYEDGSIPWVTPKDMKSWIINSSIDLITHEAIDQSAAKLIPPFSVLVVIRSGVLKHTLPVGINQVPVTVNQDLKALVCSKVVDPLYLGRFLRASARSLLKNVRGTTADNISTSVLKDLAVPLPPVEEQKRIASILDAMDALRDQRRESLAQLDALLQSTFLDMFGDPVANPMGWSKLPMGELMRIRRGGSPRPIKKYLGGSINWIKIGDATNSSDDLYITSCAEKIVEEGLSKTTLLEPGSFVFANSGVSLGFARILKLRGAIHDGWLAFDEYDSQLLNDLFFLKTLNAITDHFRRVAPSGTQPNLNTGIMKRFELILPPIELQHRFAAIVESVQQQRARQRAHLTELDTLFASLQARAFQGDL